MIWKLFIEAGFFIGLIVNAILFIPQAIKLYKNKTSKGVSVITFFGFNIIQFFTALHAYLVSDYLLLIGTILAFISCLMVTILAWHYPSR